MNLDHFFSGESGDKLWIMNSGPVMLQKKGFRVKIYTPGMHFGCDNMLGPLVRSYFLRGFHENEAVEQVHRYDGGDDGVPHPVLIP